MCKAGTIPQRKGVAQVVAQFVLKQEHTGVCCPLLESFLQDPSSEVRAETRHAFRSKQIFSIHHGEQLIGKYIASDAYTDDPTPLFLAMEEYTGSLLPYTDRILAICRECSSALGSG